MVWSEGGELNGEAARVPDRTVATDMEAKGLELAKKAGVTGAL